MDTSKHVSVYLREYSLPTCYGTGCIHIGVVLECVGHCTLPDHIGLYVYMKIFLLNVALLHYNT